MVTRFLLLAVFFSAPIFCATVVPLANGKAEIEAASEPGNLVTIEALDDLARRNWEVIGSMIARTNRLRWTDPWCGTAPNRFYRIGQGKFTELPAVRAENFRLTDHAGKSHELHYFWNDEQVKAFVLIFTANGCVELTGQLPAIRALQQKFGSRGVKFWMIDSNPADTRGAIAAEAARLGLGIPILHDRAQSVAHLYGATRAAEVVCVARDGFEIFYRGAFDERISASIGTAAENYVDVALESFLGGGENTLRATKPAGCEVPVVSAGDLSYTREIAPILQAKCVTCHSPGNIGPWAMTNHAIIQAFGPAMREQISTRQMPPWHADPEHGRFENDMSLSIEEERKLLQWLTEGAPRGTGDDPLVNVPPPPPKWPVELGEPDLIIRPPEQQISGSGIEPYRYVFVPSGLTNDTWVKAAIVRPGNRAVVHHYLVWEGQTASQMASGLASYVPGMQVAPLPPGTGILFRKGIWLTFNLHYTPTGKEETDQPELALWFHDAPPAEELKTLPLLNNTFVISPGSKEFEVRAEIPFPLPFPVTLYSMSPHMHLRGARMKFEVIEPGGRRETLLSVPKYHFHWQTGYRLAEPRRVLAGSRIVVTGAFDNSEQNMHNPDSNASIRWGDQSFEEMFIGYFEYTD